MQATIAAPQLTLGRTDVPAIDVRLWVRRGARLLFLAAGIAVTAWIMGQYGTFLVYGLPAPLLRRVVPGSPETAQV
ncbi:MAG TPA: hypothetical protein VF198_03965 [Vicinamibacterales bacterium]